MTNEEFDRRMEFILEQQAQFASDTQQLRESQVQTELLINRLAAVTLEGFKDVNAKIDALVDPHLRLTEAHGKLSESQARLSESHEKLSESQARLSESQARTDESLRNLIATVDRYFSDGRN
jgi:predicted anti-sigma-YlaC factor YlaD